MHTDQDTHTRISPGLHAGEGIESRPLGASGAREASLQPQASRRDDAGLSGGLPTILALGIVLALLVGVACVTRRFARSKGGLMGALGPGGRAPSGVVEVLARYPVARGSTLILLKLDRRVLLVSHTAGKGAASLTTLCELTDPEDVASILLKTRDDEGDSIARRFESVLAAESAPPPRQPVASRGPASDGVSAVRARLATMRGRPGVEVRA